MQKQLNLFLDRDGVINEEVDYLFKADDFIFTPGCIQALQRWCKAGHNIFIVTNQSGIGRGYYSETDFAKLTNWMLSVFEKHGISITDIAFCPHHPSKALGHYLTECHCRKPAPGMFQQLMNKHNVAPDDAIMVGDKASDLIAAERAGITNCFIVRTGHPFEQSDLQTSWHVSETLSDVIFTLLKN